MLSTQTFKREILDEQATETVASTLQDSLVALIDLSLVLKQAHWNVIGQNFRSVHLQLDEIIVTTRAGSDEVAERIVTLGAAPDGRALTVSEQTPLQTFSPDFQKVPEMVSAVADRLKSTIDQIRKSIGQVGDVDPVSEDLLIGISSALEKHLWMVQAQEA